MKKHNTPKRPNPTSTPLPSRRLTTSREASIASQEARVWRAWVQRRTARGETDVSHATFVRELREHFAAEEAHERARQEREAST